MQNKLPDFVIAALYKDTLVLADNVVVRPSQIQAQVTKKGMGKEEEIPQVEVKRWYFSDNKKNITIVVNQDDAVFITKDSLNLLTGILSACKLNLGDVAIVNYHQHAFDFNQLKNVLNPRYVFLFEVTTQQIGLPFTMPYYQVQQYSNCTFLLGPSLAYMTGETKEARIEKSKLWVCLKKMFNV